MIFTVISNLLDGESSLARYFATCYDAIFAILRGLLLTWCVIKFPVDSPSAMAHRNNFFHLYQITLNKFSVSKVKFRLSTVRKEFLNLSNLLPLNKFFVAKTRFRLVIVRTEFLNLPNLANFNFLSLVKFLTIFSKCKSDIPPHFSGPEVLTSVSTEAKFLIEIFCERSNLDDSGAS